MPLSEDQQNRFQAWATVRGVTHACPACALPELSLSDEIFSVPVHEGDPEFSGPVLTDGARMPLVQVICGNCAHTMFFAAGMIGMVQRGTAAVATVG